MPLHPDPGYVTAVRESEIFVGYRPISDEVVEDL